MSRAGRDVRLGRTQRINLCLFVGDMSPDVAEVGVCLVFLLGWKKFQIKQHLKLCFMHILNKDEKSVVKNIVLTHLKAVDRPEVPREDCGTNFRRTREMDLNGVDAEDRVCWRRCVA